MTAPTGARATSEGREATPPSLRRARGLRRRIALSVLAVGACASVLTGITVAGFSDTAISSGNQFQSGTVDIDDNDNGTAILSLSNASPGMTDEGCITVTSRGSLASTVKIYGTTTGSGLDQYVNLKITRGTFTAGPPAFDSCTNFQPDPVQYTGAGNGDGVIYAGSLQGFFDDNWAGGLVDPYADAPEVWTQNESHVYKIWIQIPTDSDPEAAQGLNATQVFTWEARNN